jgi:hypothetical protein
MELRCQNCGEKITMRVEGEGGPQEVVCAACGVQMIVAPPKPKAARTRRQRFRFNDGPRPTEVTWRRVFEPIPRLALYVAGAVLVLLLLSPFWVYLVQERYKRDQIILSDETTNIVVRSPTNVTTPLFGTNEPSVLLDQYHGVRLEAGRDEFLRRFSLRLQNTRGMEPEIYVGYRLGDFEQLTGYFYGGALKEAFLVLREQRRALDAIQRDLVEQFGESQSVADNPNRPTTGTGLGALGLGGDDPAAELQKRLAGYPLRRDLVWTDAQTRVEATIYYTSVEPAQNAAVLAVHLSAAAWLKTSQNLGGITAPTPTGPATNSLLEPPRQLFRD